MSEPVVEDRPEQSRYEIRVDGALAGFVDYELDGERIDLVHTETESGFEGQGLARRLVTDVLADARRRGLAVLPSCPYVRKVIGDHPEEHLDLVPAEERERFGLGDVAAGS